jgi:chromosome segregation ATPase
MQIFVWITLPVLLSAAMLTVYFHFRKRKKINRMAEEAENKFILATPEQFNHRVEDGDYVYFDHSGLIREYKSRMFYNHARYAALRNDYASLEAKYTSINNSKSKARKKIKKNYMKNQLDPQLPVNTDKLPEEFVTERKELSDKLEQLGKSYHRLEEENRFLLEQVNLQTAGDDEKDRIVNRWKEESKTLREKVVEKEYLEELLEEKKAQINFLQDQLEQRIKSQHQSDQQRLQAIVAMESAKQEQAAIIQQMDEVKSELLLKQEEIDKLQVSICEKEEQLSEKQQLAGNKVDQVTYLENVLRETKEQNELLNADLADRKDEIFRLQQQLSDEHSRLQYTEQKLLVNKQTLLRLHKEVSACISEEDHESSLVVSLRPSYLNKLNAEESLTV